MRTIEDMVQQEINCCMSSLVSTLASGYGLSIAHNGQGTALEGLAEQAFELAAPVPDYEEAALQAGFAPSKTQPGQWSNETAPSGFKEGEEPMFWDDAAQACGEQEIEPYDWEVYEHWAVSQWLADKLVEQGEKVDTDFAALNVWARTTTGQAISMDGCIKRIYDAMMAPVKA